MREYPSTAQTRRAGTIAAAMLSAVVMLSAPALAQDKAAFLFPGSINDQSWNAQGFAGAERLKSHGWQIGYTENVPAADMVEALRDYAGQGYKIVVGHTGRFLSAAQRVGPDFPGTLFLVGSGSAGFRDNVTSIDYDKRAVRVHDGRPGSADEQDRQDRLGEQSRGPAQRGRAGGRVS